MRLVNITSSKIDSRLEPEITLTFFRIRSYILTESRLTAAEAEVNRANLTDRLGDLDRVKNEQNLSIKSYQNEVSQLESEVRNIKLISEALPEGCFKQPRLEP